MQGGRVRRDASSLSGVLRFVSLRWLANNASAEDLSAFKSEPRVAKKNFDAKFFWLKNLPKDFLYLYMQCQI